jgi:hypothetical protein
VPRRLNRSHIKGSFPSSDPLDPVDHGVPIWGRTGCASPNRGYPRGRRTFKAPQRPANIHNRRPSSSRTRPATASRRRRQPPLVHRRTRRDRTTWRPSPRPNHSVRSREGLMTPRSTPHRYGYTPVRMARHLPTTATSP